MTNDLSDAPNEWTLLNFRVIPFQLYELLFVRHLYPSTAKGVTTSMTFNAVYLSWVFIIAQVGGFWVYPVLEVLNPIQECLW